MKRIHIKSILLVLCALLSITASACDFQYNGLYYNITTPAGSSTKTCEVTYGPSGTNTSDYTMKNLVVPEGVAYNGSRYIVTAIGENAFSNCLTLETVQLNASVKTIKRYAFSNDVNIVSFSMPGIESLEYSSLGYMKGLKALEIPACAIDIDYEAMMCAQSLESITVDPANPLFTSEDGILYSKDKKVMRVFPGGRTGEYCVPDGVEEIAISCFYGSNLSKISVPNSVKKIGGAAFRYCLKLESVDLGHGVEDMSGNYTFGSCPMLKQIVFPNSVKTIGSYFVNYCSNLEEVVFGESLEKIGNGYVSSTGDYINISSYENPTFPQNTCFKNIVMLSKQIPDGYYYTPYNSSTPTAAFPRTPYGRDELPWKNNTTNRLSSFSSLPGKWGEADSNYTGLFCKGDTLFAFSGNSLFTKSHLESILNLDQYAALSDFIYNPDVVFYSHGGFAAFDFSKTGVDPRAFVGKTIPRGELIGKTVDNIDECGIPTITLYTTPQIETALPGAAYNINTFRPINFARPADDGNGYPYYLFPPTVGEICRVVGVYNASKGGLYDSNIDYTLKLRNKTGLTDGATYTLDGIYRKIGGEAIFEVMGQVTTNSIAKQPTIEDLSVSLEHEDNNASYQWYALRQQEGAEEMLMPQYYNSWYYSYGQWRTRPNRNNYSSDYTTDLRIPIKAEKGDVLSFDWNYVDCTLKATLNGSTLNLGSNKHFEKVFTEPVDSYLYIETSCSYYKTEAYAVVSNLKLKHAEITEVPVRLEGANESRLSDESFMDGDIVYCEVYLSSGERFVSNQVQTLTNYIKKQPTYSDVSVELAIPNERSTYQWFRKRDVLQEGKDIDISALCTTNGTYKWALSNGVWTSGNNGVNSSSSTLNLTYDLQEGETLTFDCYVDSESNFDKLAVTSSLGSSYNWTASGSKQTKTYTISTPGTQTWTFVYTKDGSQHTGEDCAKISNMRVVSESCQMVTRTDPIAGATSALFDKMSEIILGDIIYCVVTLPNGRVLQSDNLTFNSDITSIELNTAEATIGIGETLPLTATILPSDAVKALVWSSSNPKVATVSSEGVVTGLSTGTTIITATAASGSTAKASATITVFQPVESITLEVSDITLKRTQSIALTANVLPSTSSNKSLSWRSDDEMVATVNNGVVTAVGVGSTTITVNTTDGSGLKATCKVTVEPNELHIVDGDQYTNTEQKLYDELTYTRSFSRAGSWNAIYLPFSIDIEEYCNDFDIAEIYAFSVYKDTNGDGEVSAEDESQLIVFKKTAGVTNPNMPYLIRPKEAKEYTISSWDGMLYPATNGHVTTSTTKAVYTVTGNNTSIVCQTNDGKYYVTASGTLSHITAAGKTTTVKPFRWILTFMGRTDSYQQELANNSKEFMISVIGEDLDMTTIRNINTDSETDRIYNTNGIRMNNANGLRPGIYIRNGKKYQQTK